MARGNTPEARVRQAAGSARGGRATGIRSNTVGNTSEKGRKGRALSPWNRGPMCGTPNAVRSFKRNRPEQS